MSNSNVLQSISGKKNPPGLARRDNPDGFLYPKWIVEHQNYDIFFNPSFYMDFAYISIFGQCPP